MVLPKKRARSPLSSPNPRALFLLDDTPVSSSFQLSQEFMRLAILQRGVNLRICRDFKRREGGSALHYTSFTQILFITFPKLFALNSSINKQNYFGNWSGRASSLTERIPVSLPPWLNGFGGGSMCRCNPINSDQFELSLYVDIP